MPDDTFCASKANMLTIGWDLAEAGVANCRFQSGQAIVTGKTFGIVTTFTQRETSVAEMDTGILTALLIIAMVIFVILFIGLAYALWVYVHPVDVSSLNESMASFQQRREQARQDRLTELNERRNKLRREEEALQKMVEEEGGDEDDEFYEPEDDNAISYQNVLTYHPTDEETAPLQSAMRGINESSRMAQSIAERTQIYQEDTMMRDQDIGEHF